MPVAARSSRFVLPASLTSVRHVSNVPTEDPKTKAQSLIDAIPGSNMVSKTAMVSSAAALSIYALSNEYYVVNEETVIAFCLLSVWVAVFKYGGPLYKEWAEAQTARIKSILDEARAKHTDSVKNRIDSVKEMGGVVDITKTLFEVSKVCTHIFGQQLKAQTAMIRINRLKETMGI